MEKMSEGMTVVTKISPSYLYSSEFTLALKMFKAAFPEGTSFFISEENMADALRDALESGMIVRAPIRDYLAAVSVGIINGEPRLDLCYAEDAAAEVDMNIVMTGSEKFVEIQGTAEGQPFSKRNYEALIALAEGGIKELISIQKEILGKDNLISG